VGRSGVADDDGGGVAVDVVGGADEGDVKRAKMPKRKKKLDAPSKRMGRPPYEPTEKDRKKLMLLLAVGWTLPRIANGLGVSEVTVWRYFRKELRDRHAMRDRIVARQFEIAMERSEEGNIPALKELGRLLDSNDLMKLGQVSQPASAPAPERKPKLGKKEQALIDARAPDEGTQIGDLMSRRDLN
jgi:hypothetical protein